MKKLYIISIIIAFIILIIHIGILMRSMKTDLSTFDIDTVTQEELINTEANYSASFSRKRRQGEKSGVTGKYEMYDFSICSYSSKKVTGILTVQSTIVYEDKNEIDFKIESTLKSGSAKIIVIRNKEILDCVEVGQVMQKTYDCAKNDLFYIKIIAKEANISIEVERQI